MTLAAIPDLAELLQDPARVQAPPPTSDERAAALERAIASAERYARDPVQRILRLFCSGCGGSLTYAITLSGRFVHLGPRCLSCHSRRHNACRRCGRCLPEWRAWPVSTRLDRHYCSDACRQAAYRERRKMKAISV